MITLSRPMIVLGTTGSGRRFVGAIFPEELLGVAFVDGLVGANVLDGVSGITVLAGACWGNVPPAVGATAAAVSDDVPAAALSCFAVPPREHAVSRRIAPT